MRVRCQTCDELLAEGAVFCKHCGTAARGLTAKHPEKLAEVVFALTVMTSVVGIGGLIFVYMLAHNFLTKGVETPALIAVLIVALAAAFGLTALLASQLSRALNAYLRPFNGPEAAPAPPDTRPTAQLEAPREPASSVTEHTTRTFDPVYVEKAKK